MNIPILVEPTATGFRAATGAPLDLTAERETADDALDAVKQLISRRMSGGAFLVMYNAPRDLLTPRLALADNPLWGDFLDAIAENRILQDAEDRARLEAEDIAAGIR